MFIESLPTVSTADSCNQSLRTEVPGAIKIFSKQDHIIKADPSLLKGPERRAKAKILQPFTGNGDASI
jgi:hypothetical protein